MIDKFIRTTVALPLFFLTFLIGCGESTQNIPNIAQSQPPVPQGTFVYVGGIAASPSAVFPTTDTDILTSYQVQSDGSLKRLGAFDSSLLPLNIFQSAAAGPWLFTCDGSPRCLEFRVDSTGNLVRGADISGARLMEVAGIDPSGNWLFASTTQGERAFRIQSDGSLVPGPNTPAPPQPPGAFPGLLSFHIITFDPTGNFAFAWNATGQTEDPGVYRFDATQGTFTRVSSLPPQGVRAIGSSFQGFTSDGRHAIGVVETPQGAGDVYVFDWDPGAGNLVVHSHGVLTVPDVSDFHPAFMAMADNFLFVEGGISDNVVFRFDPTTGTISDTGQRFPNNAVLDGPLRADARTHTVVATAPFGNLVGIWKYDSQTGATQTVSGSPYPAPQNAYILGVLSH